MKASAYIALSLPFALLLVLLASLVITPRLGPHSHAQATPAPTHIVTLPEVRVHPHTTPLVLQAATAPSTTIPAHVRSPSPLRMPYFSFAEDFSLVSGR